MTASQLPDIVKVCPSCGGRLAIRTNRKTEQPFIGCGQWPDCSYTEPVSETMKMRLDGAPELPLFEAAPAPVVTIDHCRSCGAPIVWGRTRQGKRCPYDVVDGQATQESHFLSCPHSRAWSKS